MKKILLLATKWTDAYWESDSEAPYKQAKYTDLPGWNDLSNSCPLPGIGRYFGDFSRNSFVYLTINGMGYDPGTEQPYFAFQTLEKSQTESRILDGKLPKKNRGLFSVIEPEELLIILQNIGENPPEKWRKLIETKEKTTGWRDYVGKYFLETEEDTLSNDEFEDRVAVLLKALGFKVVQKGHTLVGEFADGIVSFNNDYAIVYDCKNTQSFFPTAADDRAIQKYWGDEKKIRGEQNIYCAFVAKSFTKEGEKSAFYLPISSLLYLLYKKLFLGSKFTLSPLKKILDNRISLKAETIDNEWRE